jgi:DDE superfamily endonuclease
VFASTRNRRFRPWIVSIQSCLSRSADWSATVFEYYGHGTLSLYAALDTQSGEVLDKTVARHTSEEFVAFLSSIIVSQPKGKEILHILDNLSAHKSKRVEQFLSEHSTFIHSLFTSRPPTQGPDSIRSRSGFSKIERDVIARGIFTSVPDLRRKLMNYIKRYNRAPRPIKWSYRDLSRGITGTGSSNTLLH